MSSISYNTGIPYATNNPSADQGPMMQNTDAVNDILKVDMVGFNVANSGFHNKITFVDQTVDATSAALQYVTYAKNAATGSELYARRDGAAAVQLTRGTPVVANPGVTYLPGGLLLQFGTAVTGGGAVVAVTFPVAFAAGCPYSVTLSDIYDGRSFIISVTQTVLTMKGTVPSETIFWMAIGR